MLLSDVLKEFLFEIQIKNYTPKTQKSYRNNNALFHNYLKERFNIIELEEVNHLHIKDYVKYLQTKGRKATYVNSILKNLRSYFEYCVKETYINNNPCKKVNWQKEGKVIINSFTNLEVSKMLQVYNYSNFLNARNKCIIAMFFDTGIRNYELCCLKRSDVRDTIIRVLGKGNKERYVSISPMLKKILIKWGSGSIRVINYTKKRDRTHSKL